MVRLSRVSVLLLALLLAALLQLIPGVWIIGFVAASIPPPLRAGVHSDHFTVWFALAVGINIVVLGGPIYWLLAKWFLPRKTHSKVMQAPQTPKKGILYTDSEIEDFKRRGMM